MFGYKGLLKLVFNGLSQVLDQKIIASVVQIEIEVVAVIGVIDIGGIYACNPEV